jgi:phage protein D
MNNVAQNRVGTTFSVTFPDFPTFNNAPQWVRLHQEAGKQDIVEIAYASFSSFYYKSLKTGVPFKLTWVTEHGKGEFFGYVYDVSMTTQASVRRNVIIRGMGSSFPLKEGGSKIWANKSAPDIVSDICKTFKLKPVVTSHPVKFAQQSMVGHTYWEKVQELAQRIGYVAQVIGTELHFHPVDKMIDRFSTSIPALSFSDGDLNAGAVYEAQTLDKFKPTIGDHLETAAGHTKRDKIVSGIDPVTGKTFSHTASPSKVGKAIRKTGSVPLFKEVIPTRIADSASVAKSMAEGFALLSRFNIGAEAAGQGDPRIAPYRTVEINGTGETSDGFWVVMKATHFITYDGRYTVEFNCVTDGTGDNKSGAFRPTKAGVVGTRNISFESTTSTVSKPSSTKLSSKAAMIKQTQTGFKVTPRRWTGK